MKMFGIRMYRVIEASTFINHFASDRSHMLIDDKWSSPPPTYQPIQTQQETMNLHRYINMTENKTCNVFGSVMNEDEFIAMFS